MNERCKFIKTNGERCKRHAQTGSEFCYAHDETKRHNFETSLPETLIVRDKRTPGRFFVDNDFVDYIIPLAGKDALIVYVGLLRYTDLDTQRTKTSLATLSDMMGLSKRQIQRKIKQLCALGVIAKETRKRKIKNGVQYYHVNVYAILDKSQWRIDREAIKAGMTGEAYQGRLGRHSRDDWGDIAGMTGSHKDQSSWFNPQDQSSDHVENSQENPERKEGKERTKLQNLLPTCPSCGAAMVIREGPHGDFLGCSRYPQCRQTLAMQVEHEEITTADSDVSALLA